MRSGIGVAGEEVATITPNSTLSLTVDDGIKCPLLANKRSSDHLRATSGLAPTADIRVAPFVACALLHRHPCRPFLG